MCSRILSIKTYYGTVSDDELKLLFGNETPLAENVLKIATEDPNGVTTIQYQLSNGKLLATALNYSEDENPNLDEIGSEPELGITVSNKITKSIKKENSLVSQKRISLLDVTNNLTLNFQYMTKK